jgi:hypothetical protein
MLWNVSLSKYSNREWKSKEKVLVPSCKGMSWVYGWLE